MNIKDLKAVIKECVREVMQEELREILTEAVEIASKPEQPTYARPRSVAQYMPDLGSELGAGLSDLLQETAQSMTSADYAAVMGNTKPPVPDFGMIGAEEQTYSTMSDLPPFAMKAKQIFDAANKIQR